MRRIEKMWILLLLAILAAIYPIAGVALDKAIHGNERIYRETDIVDLMDDLAATFPIGEIGPGREVRQSFVLKEDQILSLEFILVAYDRKNAGTVNVSLLRGSNGEVLQSWEEDISTYSTGSISFEVDPWVASTMEANSTYVIDITTNGARAGKAISVLISKSDRYAKGTLVVDGEKRDGDLCFAVKGAGDVYSLARTHFWMRTYAALMAELLLVYIFLRSRRRNGASAEC